jgi:hypothetical protein
MPCIKGEIVMWKKLSLLALLGLIVAVVPGSPAYAQATRTWVSGAGDDANPCSRSAPCKTFAGALPKTAAGGEVDALDPGGFASVTITKSITIDGGGGEVASVLVSGTNGINVAAGAKDVVILKNLRLQGLLGNGSSPTTAGINGINFTAGAQLVIDNCDIYGFNNSGLNVAVSTTSFVAVRNSTFRNNLVSGISSSSSGGFGVVQVVNSSFVGTNNSGTQAQTGVIAGSGGAIDVSNSSFQDLNIAIQATGNGILNIDSSFIGSNHVGISTVAGTTLNASNNGFYNNNTAFAVAGTSTSTGNNRVVGALGTFAPSTMTQK